MEENRQLLVERAQALQQRTASSPSSAHWRSIIALAGPPGSDKSTVAAQVDHAVKNPVPDGVAVPPDATVIILEGNWLLYDEEPWSGLASLVDETWFIDVEPSVAELRVARRRLQSGIEETWEAALKRARENDAANGREVREKLIRPDIVVKSAKAKSWNGLGPLNG